MTQISVSGQATPAPATGMSGTAPTAPVAPPFSPEERAVFRSEDKHAAAGVVGEMVAIFTLALIGYTVIAVIVAWGW